MGTVSTPTLAATNLATSMRRWWLTSAATADSAAEQRSAGWACWRGKATGLGGWTFVTRLSLAPLQATGMGFFGLYGSTAALATTLTLATTVNCVGSWQIVHNDASGAPTLINANSAFTLSTDAVVTLIIEAAPNAGSVWVRIVVCGDGLLSRHVRTWAPASCSSTCPRSTGCRRCATGWASRSSSARPIAAPSTIAPSAAQPVPIGICLMQAESDLIGTP